MQFGGGYRFPSWPIFGIITIIVAVNGVWLWRLGKLNGMSLVIFFLDLEGAAMLISAFTPVGQLGPQGSLLNKMKWFFIGETSSDGTRLGITYSLSQPLLYGGFLLILTGRILSEVYR